MTSDSITDESVAELIAEKNAEIVALRAQLPPAPAADQVWRVGTKCPMNLYAHADDLAERGEPVGVMRSSELAAHVVQAVNERTDAEDARTVARLLYAEMYGGIAVPDSQALHERIENDPALGWLRGEEQPPGVWTPKETDQ